jgi:hypothetical protein
MILAGGRLFFAFRPINGKQNKNLISAISASLRWKTYKRISCRDLRIGSILVRCSGGIMMTLSGWFAISSVVEHFKALFSKACRFFSDAMTPSTSIRFPLQPFSSRCSIICKKMVFTDSTKSSINRGQDDAGGAAVRATLFAG